MKVEEHTLELSFKEFSQLNLQVTLTPDLNTEASHHEQRYTDPQTKK